MKLKKSDSTVAGQGVKRNRVDTAIWKGWQYMNTVPLLQRTSERLMGLAGSRLPVVGPLKAWCQFRSVPRLAPKSLHQIAREQGVDDE